MGATTALEISLFSDTLSAIIVNHHSLSLYPPQEESIEATIRSDALPSPNGFTAFAIFE
jgi:hypothetical protein